LGTTIFRTGRHAVQPAQDSAAPAEALRQLLFLDFDGVLHPDQRKDGARHCIDGIVAGTVDPRTLGLLCARRQALLAGVLQDHPGVDIVITSAWRTWHLDGSLDWLRLLLHPVIAARIIGATPHLGLVGDFGMPLGRARRQEIDAFLAAMPGREHYADRWIALDDSESLFFDSRDGEFRYFYREVSDDRTFTRYGLLPSLPRRSDTVLVLDGRDGLGADSAAMLRAALAGGSGDVDAVATDAVRQTVGFNVLRFVGELVDVATDADVRVCLPATAGAAPRDAIFGALAQYTGVEVLSVDVTRTADPEPPVALAAYLQAQWHVPVVPPHVSGWGAVWYARARAGGKRRCVIVLEGMERLPADATREAWLDAAGLLAQAINTAAGTTVATVAAFSVIQVAPAEPQRKWNNDPRFYTYVFPDPAVVRYRY
jgi:hypothetical protein